MAVLKGTFKYTDLQVAAGVVRTGLCSESNMNEFNIMKRESGQTRYSGGEINWEWAG